MSEFFSYKKPEKGDDDHGMNAEEQREYDLFIERSADMEDKAKDVLIEEAKGHYPKSMNLGGAAISVACLSMAASALRAATAALRRNMAKGKGSEACGLANMLLGFWDENIVPMAEKLRAAVNEANGK